MDIPEPPSPPATHPGSSRQTGYGTNGPRVPSTVSNSYFSGIGLLLVVVGLWVSSSFLMSGRIVEPALACHVCPPSPSSRYLKKHEGPVDGPFVLLVFRCVRIPRYICTSSFVLYLVRPTLTHLLSAKPSVHQRGRSAKRSEGQEQPQESRVAYTALVDNGQGSEPTGARIRSVSRAFSAPERPLTTNETAWLAASFSCLWFAANWTVNAALGYTSVSSTTILSSMSGFFTLGCGVAVGVEKFSIGRLGAVGMSVLGVILVSKSDHEMAGALDANGTGRLILGDALALSSAALYAVYVLLMKVKVKDESRVDMQLFFGCVGAINLVCFWPVGVLLHYTGIEPFVLPNSRKLWLSVGINAMITFVSDFLYMLAMLKTSPLIVTLGLSLTLPVAVLGDLIKGSSLSFTSLLGAALVLSSFVLLSTVEKHDTQ